MFQEKGRRAASPHGACLPFVNTTYVSAVPSPSIGTNDGQGETHETLVPLPCPWSARAVPRAERMYRGGVEFDFLIDPQPGR